MFKNAVELDKSQMTVIHDAWPLDVL